MKQPKKKRRLMVTPKSGLAPAGSDTLARKAKYLLRLYISGSTSKSALAISNIKRICEQYLKNRYDLEVIDIYQQPSLARDQQIVAVPTLIKQFPPPQRRLIGDLSNSKTVLVGLDVGIEE
jgi:circadian clock protein KaiB